MGSQEALLDLEQKTEGYPSTDVGVCDDEVSEAAGGWVGAGVIGGSVGDVVDVVLVVGVGELLWRVVGDLREDQRCERGGAGGGGCGVLGEDGCAIGDA